MVAWKGTFAEGFSAAGRWEGRVFLIFSAVLNFKIGLLEHGYLLAVVSFEFICLWY